MGGAGWPTLRSGTWVAGSIASASLFPEMGRQDQETSESQEWHPWVLQPGDLWPSSFSVLSSYFVPGLTTPKAPSLIIQYFLQTL